MAAWSGVPSKDEEDEEREKGFLGECEGCSDGFMIYFWVVIGYWVLGGYWWSLS